MKNEKNLESILNEFKDEMKKEINSLKNELKNEMKSLENRIGSLENELKNVKETIEFQELKYNTLKEVLSIRNSYSTMEEYRGEYVSEGLGLNSRKRKFVNNPYW